jgi:hypothetical protein
MNKGSTRSGAALHAVTESSNVPVAHVEGLSNPKKQKRRGGGNARRLA